MTALCMLSFRSFFSRILIKLSFSSSYFGIIAPPTSLLAYLLAHFSSMRYIDNIMIIVVSCHCSGVILKQFLLCDVIVSSYLAIALQDKKTPFLFTLGIIQN